MRIVTWTIQALALVAVVVGVSMIYIPAAWVVAGVFVFLSVETFARMHEQLKREPQVIRERDA